MTMQMVYTGHIVEETTVFTLGGLSKACGQSTEWILLLVSEGIIDPINQEDTPWQFSGECLRQLRIVKRLESDLGLNIEGAGLVLDLLDEVESLRNRIAVLEQNS